jgi:hypothetical protein
MTHVPPRVLRMPSFGVIWEHARLTRRARINLRAPALERLSGKALACRDNEPMMPHSGLALRVQGLMALVMLSQGPRHVSQQAGAPLPSYRCLRWKSV